MTKSEKKANNAIPRQTLKICRGCLFVYSGAIINQLTIYSLLILRTTSALFLIYNSSSDAKVYPMLLHASIKSARIAAFVLEVGCKRIIAPL